MSFQVELDSPDGHAFGDNPEVAGAFIRRQKLQYGDWVTTSEGPSGHIDIQSLAILVHLLGRRARKSLVCPLESVLAVVHSLSKKVVEWANDLYAGIIFL